MLRQTNFCRQFADCAKSGCAFGTAFQHNLPYLPLATCTRILGLARNVSTLRGAMGTSTPVFGFRPIRATLSRNRKLPKPEIFTFSPFAKASDIPDKIDSTNPEHSARDSPI
jgi:hypothetical protein